MSSSYPTQPPKAPESACVPPGVSDDSASVSSNDIEPSALIPEPEDETIVDKIISIFLRLSARSTLSPGPVVNALFGELMTICLMSCPDKKASLILSDPRIQDILPNLHTLCSQSEFEMERYWAERITEAQDPVLESKQFTYYENYVDLTRLELAALSAVDTKEIRSVAFIGSGPLPLTSLCLLEQLGGRSLGHIAEGMEFQLGEASSKSKSKASTDLTSFDVVFLAALVGSTQVEKEAVLKDVVSRMRKGSLLVVRSVHGLRGLCYPVFDPSCEGVWGKGGVLEVGVVVRPFGVVVNSVVVGKVR
ncbi:Nicotianamine synthase protein-domain-containing protein [Amylocarpus encephaloides]|uniref:Nicotianamine synthase protein-domain-containing protein n=1 Tax=Amylocarpus encephaloides TaxID=45428 RepID=A0A9P8C3T4_9HELO|nr:Nicotianamine synthase protein-domain-containing protein [Amylocarpus encephaloides]